MRVRVLFDPNPSVPLRWLESQTKDPWRMAPGPSGYALILFLHAIHDTLWITWSLAGDRVHSPRVHYWSRLSRPLKTCVAVCLLATGRHDVEALRCE